VEGLKLFEVGPSKREERRPLADRMRPESLEEFEGQEHLLGKGKVLRTLIEGREVPSMVLWGPPGVGKTTLAYLIGKELGLTFVPLSAVSIGVKEVKEIIRRSKREKIILFLDEFHRFNKLQQDTFLPYVEKGDIILIGATTENPSFEVIGPLLSRMKVFTLKELTEEQIQRILRRAIERDSVLRRYSIDIEDGVISQMAFLADGDARKALNLLEVCFKLAKTAQKKVSITEEVLREASHRRILLHDKKGDRHYDLISAFHKSLRGSDPDAALYWLVRMIEAGEDPLYIARRMIRFASEDVGNADPQALTLAVSAFQAFDFIGAPEGYLCLAQVAVYLALCEKSNTIYKAYEAARRDVRDGPAYPVPLHLRNAPTELMESLGYGRGYLYPHNFEGAIVPQEYLPEALSGRRYYFPTGRGYERRLAEFIEKVRRIKEKKGGATDGGHG